MWQVASSLNIISRVFFPEPTAIGQAFLRLADTGVLESNGLVTIERIVLGFMVGLATGTFLGVLIARVKPAAWLVNPLIAITFPIPAIVLLPILLVIFGLGSPPLIVLAAIMTFYPVVINVSEAVNRLGRELVEMATNLGASRVDILRVVLLPGSLPGLFVGIRLGLMMALLGTVAGEFVAATHGLGALLWQSWQVYKITEMYAVLLAVILLGLLIAFGFDYIRLRLFWWAEPERGYRER